MNASSTREGAKTIERSLLGAVFQYYRAFFRTLRGAPPRSLWDVHAWCYQAVCVLWHAPISVHFGGEEGGDLCAALTQSSETQKGLLRAVTRSRALIWLTFLIWPVIAFGRARARPWRRWVENWLVGIHRPDLLIAVGVGPFEMRHIEELPSSLLHVGQGAWEFNRLPSPSFKLDRKTDFHEIVSKQGIPTPRNIDPDHTNPDTVYIAKPINSGQGRGIFLVSGSDIPAMFNRNTHILQERLTNHTEIARVVGPEAGLSTLRIGTLRRADGGVVFFGGFFRLSARGKVVDNFHAGGIGAPLDKETGKLGFGMHDATKQLGWGKGLLDRHPETGVVFANTFVVPHFADARDMCLRAHETLCPDVFFVSWDVAVTDSGPYLVECSTLFGGAMEVYGDPDFGLYMRTLQQRIIDNMRQAKERTPRTAKSAAR